MQLLSVCYDRLAYSSIRSLVPVLHCEQEYTQSSSSRTGQEAVLPPRLYVITRNYRRDRHEKGIRIFGTPSHGETFMANAISRSIIHPLTGIPSMATAISCPSRRHRKPRRLRPHLAWQVEAEGAATLRNGFLGFRIRHLPGTA